MENNNIKKQNAFISEEEKTLNWDEIKNSLKKLLAVKFTIVGYKRYL